MDCFELNVNPASEQHIYRWDHGEVCQMMGGTGGTGHFYWNKLFKRIYWKFNSKVVEVKHTLVCLG